MVHLSVTITDESKVSITFSFTAPQIHRFMVNTFSLHDNTHHIYLIFLNQMK